jgi:hypothetical protein
MKRYVQGLSSAGSPVGNPLPDGLFLVRVQAARYQWHSQKPYFVLRFTILEPCAFANRSVAARIYCTPKALWKLNWFLREFGYDNELIGRDEIDDKLLTGLRGVVKVSTVIVHGNSLVNLNGFATAEQWKDLSHSTMTPATERAS